ncbi:hypothetical protein C8R45DRAFT_416473 [Mycena sanguinolenta]|nr:hypothetical protein C8R45DRAFT_416473 [Mycena sanguinolenta]
MHIYILPPVFRPSSFSFLSFVSFIIHITRADVFGVRSSATATSPISSKDKDQSPNGSIGIIAGSSVTGLTKKDVSGSGSANGSIGRATGRGVALRYPCCSSLSFFFSPCARLFFLAIRGLLVREVGVRDGASLVLVPGGTYAFLSSFAPQHLAFSA